MTALQMDEQGFLGAPGQITCRGCRAGIDADGSNPATRYAGTFTGLCIACERAPAVSVAKLHDGAARWSWPAYCPSFRRDRQEFIGYEGCICCKGQGRTIISRSDAKGGSYPVNCPFCFERYLVEPMRRAYSGVVEVHCKLWQERYDRFLKVSAVAAKRGLSTLSADAAGPWFAALMVEEEPRVPPGVF